tara:strand:- start:685 stop:1662 length:978 start_codon:yes stop_codon:yes gene_type:complete
MNEYTKNEFKCNGFTPFLKTRSPSNPRLKGIAEFCDWEFHYGKFYGDENIQPKSIFVKTDDLPTFVSHYLPKIKNTTRFVLVAGDSDKTLPRVMNNSGEHRGENVYPFIKICHDLLNDERVYVWYAENCDYPRGIPKLKPMPLGILDPQTAIPGQLDESRISNLKINFNQRVSRAMCMNRWQNRPIGSDNRPRRMVENFAKNHWTGVDIISEGSYNTFCENLQKYSFSVCVGAGGIDPSPKAWISMIEGCIPILEKRAGVYEAYKEYPVVWIDWFYFDSITQEKLNTWLEELRPHYEDPTLRCELLHKLSLNHWISKIQNDVNNL